MNSIEAMNHQTKFMPHPHLVIAIDGTPLDTILAAAFPQHQLMGLVPTLLDWIEDDRERQIVWERILPPNGKRSVAPILMCPDDLDFSCSIVVADISADSDAVYWRQFGIDHSEPEDLPDNIGAHVDWLDGVGPFTFDRIAYHRMLEAFQCSTKPCV